MRNIYLSANSIVFLILVILFQPSRATFLSIRPSDVVLLGIYISQVLSGAPRIEITSFKFLKNFGIYYATIVAISLLVLVYHSLYEIPLFNLFFIYHFVRFYLIFIVVSKILIYDDKFETRLFSGYLLIIFAVILTACAQYYQIEPFSNIIDKYYVEDELLDIYSLEELRVTGIIGNTNGLAIIMASAAPVFIFNLLKKGQNSLIRHAVNLVGFILLVLAVIFLTSSRTSLVAIMFCLLFILLINIMKDSEHNINILFIIIISVIVLIIVSPAIEKFLPERVYVFFENPLQDKRDEGNLFNRTFFWEGKMKIFNYVKYPMKGVFGLSNIEEDLTFADNGILTSYFNAGIMGIALRITLYFYFIILLAKITIIHQASRSGQTDLMFLAVMIATLLMFFDFTAEVLEYYKISQVLYIYITISVVKFNLLKSNDGLIYRKTDH
jgi:hypothetical protein